MVRDIDSPGLNILVIGAADHEEMSDISAWLQSLGGRADVCYKAHLPQAADPAPDLIVVAQSWPDEFSSSEVNAAFGRWPLAQWVVCFGAWCESDGRTRTIWPIGLRVPARAAASRLNHVWDIVTGRRIEPLPITASRDEAFEFDSLFANSSDLAAAKRHGRNVLVVSPDAALRQWLFDLVVAWGASASVGSIDQLAAGTIVIWDVDPDWEIAIREIARLRQQRSDLCVVALAGLAHPEFVTAMHALEVDIITKVSATAALYMSSR